MWEVQPIREAGKIVAMRRWLRGSPSGQRDEALFILGINCGLRVSDLLALRIGQVVDAKGRILEAMEIVEAKTGKTRRFPINKAAREVLAPLLARSATDDGGLERPLFPSRKGGGPITRKHAHRILSQAGRAVGLAGIGTHSLRKTFGYHVYQRTGGNLALVQKLLNHRSSGDTLRYIGIDREQMDAAYIELNLG